MEKTVLIKTAVVDRFDTESSRGEDGFAAVMDSFDTESGSGGDRLIQWTLVERTECHSGEDGFDTLGTSGEDSVS